MTEIYLVRHGETQCNKRKVYYGNTDCGLNEEGLKQCKDLKYIFKRENILFKSFKDSLENNVVIISSTLKRALQTASIISGLNKEEIKLSQELKELNFGIFENLTYKEIEKNFPKEWKLWCEDYESYKIPKGESFLEFYYRVVEFLEKMLELYKDKKIMIVSHDGVIRNIISYLLCKDYSLYWNLKLNHGSYSKIIVEEGNATLIKLNSF